MIRAKEINSIRTHSNNKSLYDILNCKMGTIRGKEKWKNGHFKEHAL